MASLDLWLRAWRRRADPEYTPGLKHVILCICEHFRPQTAGKAAALDRLALWRREFARSGLDLPDGIRPRHTLFYPIENFDADIAAALAGARAQTGCEIEVRLDQNRRTPQQLREALLNAKTAMAQVGLLARDKQGKLRYAVTPAGTIANDSHCAPGETAAALRDTGCYAQFILDPAFGCAGRPPSNSLYYVCASAAPESRDSRRRVYADREQRIGIERELLTVQSPLALDWTHRSWGILPRLETGELSAPNPPTLARLATWIDCHISVKGRPNWLFVTLHKRSEGTENAASPTAEPIRAFYESLSNLASLNPSIRFHYATARETVNTIHAAEAAHSGDPTQFRDYRYAQNSGNSEGAACLNDGQPAS